MLNVTLFPNFHANSNWREYLSLAYVPDVRPTPTITNYVKNSPTCMLFHATKGINSKFLLPPFVKAANFENESFHGQG